VAQTLANPVVGFRIVTSGDAVAVDIAQCEVNDFSPGIPSSSIVTTSATQARGAETLDILCSAIPDYSQTAGTWVIDFRPGLELRDRGQLNVSDTTTDNRYFLASDSGGGARFFMGTGGVEQAHVYATGEPVIVANTNQRVGAAYAADDIAMVYNGTSPATDSTATLPTVTRVRFENVSGWLQRARYFNVRKSNGDLQLLAAAP
jgi:hypothetical protein